MSYQEKRTIASIISGFIVLTAYCIYAFGRIRAGAAAIDDTHFWTVTMLVFIGIGVGAAILIQILFHVSFAIALAVKNKIRDASCDDASLEKMIDAETTEDERDRLVELKSMRFGYAIVGVGFVAGLAVLAWNGSVAVMLNVLYLSFLAGSLIEGFVQLCLYRRGR